MRYGLSSSVEPVYNGPAISGYNRDVAALKSMKLCHLELELGACFT